MTTTKYLSIISTSIVALSAFALHIRFSANFSTWIRRWDGSQTPRVPFDHAISRSDIRILSYEPFIAHISDFVTAAEREALLRLSSSILAPSTVLLSNGSRVLSEDRTSSTAYLPHDGHTVQTILARAAEFQGFLRVEDMDIQVTSYRPGQQYVAHYDWFLEPGRTTNRLSTFFAILDADCVDCGTQFPNVPVEWATRDARWCEYVDCTKHVLTTKNIPGSAIYWHNLNSDGQGRADTLHAGLPAFNGSKVGLNIWTMTSVPSSQAVQDLGLF